MNDVSHVLFSNERHCLSAIVPSEQLVSQSLQIISTKKLLSEWSKQDHADSYEMMQKIAQAWGNDRFTDQYLVCGKVDGHPFKWEVVPYQKCRTFLGRIIQQLQVLWRTIFGGIAVSEDTRSKQLQHHQSMLEKLPEVIKPQDRPHKSNDAFCKNETIERQWVIIGKKVNVLFNYAPVGFGGERLHFLIVPKEHRETFTDVTQEEYCESIELATRLVDHFTQNRKTIKNVYLLNKTGVDTGQTVNHWLLHLIFSTSISQDFWGKLTVMKNILFGTSPMRKEALAKRVSELRNEFANEQPT